VSDEQNTTTDEEQPTVVALNVSVDGEAEDITHVTIDMEGTRAGIEVHIPRGMPRDQMIQFQGVASNLAYILDGIFDSLNSDDEKGDDDTIVVVVG
jgi:hypothetical protein